MNHMEKMTAGSIWGIRYAKLICASVGIAMSASSLSAQDFAAEETKRRIENSGEAVKLVAIAEAAYEAKNYKEAVDSYQKALNLLPDGPATRDYKQAVRDNYAVVVVAYTKQLNRVGENEKASKLLAGLLEQKEFKDDQGLIEAENKILDPIRSNPSATPEHVANVDKVRRALYQAEGFYNLGQYDKAKARYEDVLRIDKTNVAARRGITLVNKEITDYARAAYDATRSELLTKVDQQWETDSILGAYIGRAVPVPELDQGEFAIESGVRQKLTQIKIPRFDVEDATLEAALNRFKQLCKKYDLEVDPNKKGVNVILNLGGQFNTAGQAIAKKKFTLGVKNIPADKLLDLICKSTNTEWSSDEFSVTVLPAGQNVDQFFTRRFSVPPGFILGDFKSEGVDSDIWTELGESEVGRVSLTAKEYLEKLGVKFPEGASAFYVKNANTLTVTNNPENMRVIAAIVAERKRTQNVIVNVRFRVIDLLQTDLEELGYDWISGHHSFSSSTSGLFIGGGNAGNGTPIEPIQIVNRPVNGTGLTSGLRSGNSAFTADGIDSRINEVTNLDQAAAAGTRAPGILQTTQFLDESHIQVIIRGLNQKKGTSRIWSPSISTRPGERARIEQTRLFTYATEYDPPEIPDTVGNTSVGDGDIAIVPITPATPTAFEERPLGNIIEVEPVVGPNRQYISLTVEPEFSEFRGFINYGSPIMGLGTSAVGTPTQIEVSRNDILMPVFEKTTARTTVNIADGATIAIAGINRVELEQVTDRVPVLSSLPFIGDYYKSNGTRTIRRAVIMLVTAELVDPTGKAWRNK